VLRDLYVRGKCRDVILPMVVIRRMDAVLEPTKKNVLDMKASLDRAGITNQDAALRNSKMQRGTALGNRIAKVKTGYEISFTRYFYKPKPLRSLEEIRADLLAVEKEAEGVLGEILGGRG